MTEAANSAIGWVSRNITAQFVLCVILAAVGGLGVVLITQERVDVLAARLDKIETYQSARDAGQDTRSSAKDEAQDERQAQDHEQILLLVPKIEENAKDLARVNASIDSRSTERARQLEGIAARIENVEKAADAKIAAIQAEQRKVGEMMATLIERLANISEQIDSLTRLMRDRLPEQRR